MSLYYPIPAEDRQSKKRNASAAEGVLGPNLHPLGGDSFGLARQLVAASLRGRFSAAVLVDGLCALFGWRLAGFAEIASGACDELLQTPDLEWLHPDNDDRIVRLVIGDDALLSVSADGGDTWSEITLHQLGDTLGDWALEMAE